MGSKNYLSKENILAGTFDEKKDAVAARKEAEYHLYRDFLKWYNCKYDKWVVNRNFDSYFIIRENVIM